MKVYVDREGIVWYADGTRSPLHSGLDGDAFLRHVDSRDAWCVRVLGIPQNAALIVQLQTLLVSRLAADAQAVVRLEIAGPLVCETAEELADPVIAMYRMRQCLRSPSLGGWHVATRCDLASYQLIAFWHASFDNDPAEQPFVELARQHPVWHDLQFIGGLGEYWAACVLCYLADPRWFIDPVHPERVSRARAYLGLEAKTQDRLAIGDYDRPKVLRHHAVLYSWFGESPPFELLEQPEYFLWRRWRSRGGGCPGMLSGSNAFVAYLLRTWQQRIADCGTSGQHLEMFLPDSLLRPDEAAAWRKHDAARLC